MFACLVPPAMPACLAYGTLIATLRLNNAQIYCTDPNRVNLAATIKTFVFDKTGTLTEEEISI